MNEGNAVETPPLNLKPKPDSSKPAKDTSDQDDYKAFLDEVDALCHYIAGHGDILQSQDDIDKEAKTQSNKTAFKDLAETLAAASTGAPKDFKARLLTLYAEVTAFTYGEKGINGRTILDTKEKTRLKGDNWLIQNVSRLYRWVANPKLRPTAVALLMFVFVMGLEWTVHWRGLILDNTALDSLNWDAELLILTIDSLSPFLIPAAWGAIGACIFLMKRLSDLLFQMAFEKARVKGDMTRIFLGSMLGVIVVVLFFPDYGEEIKVGEASFGPATVAFIAGLSIKPVYAAFETLSEALAKRFS